MIQLGDQKFLEATNMIPRKFLLDAYPKAFASFAFGCVLVIAVPPHTLDIRFLITSILFLFIIMPVVYYPTWLKRQSFSPIEENAFKERRNINLITFALCFVLGIPLTLLICVCTKNIGVREILVIIVALGLYFSIYHIVRKKLHHPT